MLFAAEPYSTIAFKIPNKKIDKSDEKSYYFNWDTETKIFTLFLTFVEEDNPTNKRQGLSNNPGNFS